jgi:hypothetical protein
VDRGVERTWDIATRTTRQPGKADSVEILTIVSGGALQDPHIIIIRQYRPPIDTVSIELPAGAEQPPIFKVFIVSKILFRLIIVVWLVHLFATQVLLMPTKVQRRLQFEN